MIMKIRCVIGSAAFAAAFTYSGAWAWDQDPAALYLERKDTIVSGAGDARDVNAATHIIDPWPRNVGNRRIPMSGERAAKTVECYETYNQGRPKGGAPTVGTQPSASASVTIGGVGGSSSPCAHPPIQNLYDRTIGIVGTSQ
jgi:hypothetical protein